MSVPAINRINAALYCLLITALPGIIIGESVAADEISDAEARWSSSSINDYSFTLTQRVMWGATTIVLIQVRQGKLASASHIIKRTNPVPDHEASNDSGMRKTIDDLFAGIKAGESFLRADFDPVLGYPVNIYYQNADWDEAEDQLEIRDFQILKDAGPAG
jgi:hypothetical protein